VVRVTTFTKQHRRIKVDLETGRRRSWVETEEKELIDLCGGQTPAKPPAEKRPRLAGHLKDISNLPTTGDRQHGGTPNPCPLALTGVPLTDTVYCIGSINFDTSPQTSPPHLTGKLLESF